MAFVTTARRHRSLLSVLRRHTRFSSSSAAAVAAASPPSPPPADPFILPSRDPAILRLARQSNFSAIESLINSRMNSTHASSEPYLASLILQYASAGMIDHAIRTFTGTSSAPRTTLSFNALLSSCNHSRKHSPRVPDLFADLSRKHSISPDKVSYGILIKSICLSGDASKAFPVLKEMEAKNIEITTIAYTTLLDAFYKERKPEEAEKIWKEMARRGAAPDLPAYNVRAMHVAARGKPSELLALMDEMESAGLKPDSITYNYLISCYCKNGRFDDARKVYESFKEKGCSPNSLTYKIVLAALCKRGEFDSAVRLFNESVRQEKVLDFGTVKRLVEGLVKVGKKKAAEKIVQGLSNRHEVGFVGDWKKLEKLVGLDVDKGTSKEEELIAA